MNIAILAAEGGHAANNWFFGDIKEVIVTGLASIILFGSFLAWAVWDRIAAKRRGDPLPVAGSSLIPDVLSVVIGLALYVVFVLWAHQWLFGVAPVVM